MSNVYNFIYNIIFCGKMGELIQINIFVYIVQWFLQTVSDSSAILQEMRCMWKVKVKLLSRVQLFATPWPVVHQAPLSMRFFQARILEWVAISFSGRASWTRDRTRVSCVSCMGGQILCRCTTWEALQVIIYLFKPVESITPRANLAMGSGYKDLWILVHLWWKKKCYSDKWPS